MASTVKNPEDVMNPSEDEILAARQSGGPRPEAVELPKAAATAVESQSTPGVYVDQSRFVVLASRLGRQMEPLPKRDPNDEKEDTKYFVPEAFERGEVITIDDLWVDSTGKIDNIARLMRTGAIGRLDHPEAAGAIEGLRYRQEQERAVLISRGLA